MKDTTELVVYNDVIEKYLLNISRLSMELMNKNSNKYELKWDEETKDNYSITPKCVVIDFKTTSRVVQIYIFDKSIDWRQGGFQDSISINLYFVTYEEALDIYMGEDKVREHNKKAIELLKTIEELILSYIKESEGSI
jgi:hypothetical protein